MNPSHLFDSEAVEVVASLHSLARGYVQPVERVMAWFGKPVIVRYTRKHRARLYVLAMQPVARAMAVLSLAVTPSRKGPSLRSG